MPNMALSFFQGHGDGEYSGAACTSAATCTSPPYGSLPDAGDCVFNPITYTDFGTGKGVCEYASSRCLVTCGNGDAGSSTNANHAACMNGGNMVLGENPTEGGWRGAGTNGGTSLAIIHMSNGLTTWFPNLEWSSLYGGIHMYAGTMPTYGGDTCDSGSFGYAVAHPYSTNPSGAVSTSYTNAISNNPDCTGCPGGASYGGGFNGCGCHVIVSYANTSAHATALAGQSWNGLTTDSGDYATSTAFYSYTVGCNYNITKYGWNGGN